MKDLVAKRFSNRNQEVIDDRTVWTLAHVCLSFRVKLQCLPTGQWLATCPLLPKLKVKALAPDTARHQITTLIEEALPELLRKVKQ